MYRQNFQGKLVVDNHNVSMAELAAMEDVQKDELIIKLCGRIKEMENHRGNRIDLVEFENWQNEIFEEKSKNAKLLEKLDELSKEITRLKMQIENQNLCPGSPVPQLLPPPLHEISSSQICAIVTETVSSSSQTSPVKFVGDVHCFHQGTQTHLDSIFRIDESTQTFESETDKPLGSVKIDAGQKSSHSSGVIKLCETVDEFLLLDELNNLFLVLCEMGGDNSAEMENVWVHTRTNCGLLASLAYLRRLGKQCSKEVNTMRAMMINKLSSKQPPAAVTSSKSKNNSGLLGTVTTKKDDQIKLPLVSKNKF